MSNLKIVFGTEDSFGNLDFSDHYHHDFDRNSSFDFLSSISSDLDKNIEEAKKDLGKAFYCGLYTYDEEKWTLSESGQEVQEGYEEKTVKSFFYFIQEN